MRWNRRLDIPPPNALVIIESAKRRRSRYGNVSDPEDQVSLRGIARDPVLLAPGGGAGRHRGTRQVAFRRRKPPFGLQQGQHLLVLQTPGGGHHAIGGG